MSVAEGTMSAALHALSGLPFAEVRLDAMCDAGTRRDGLFSPPAIRIATCRRGGPHDPRRAALLLDAVEEGAAMVDMELDAPAALRNEVVAAARAAGCIAIVSHHDFGGTPSRTELQDLVEGCFDAGADIAKIACAVKTTAECSRLIGLLDDPRDVVVAGMGAMGPRSRVMALLAGAPFVYASISKGRETAPGQIDVATLDELQAALKRAGL